MKRTAIIALALLAALTALGCNESLDYTALNMNDYNSQFDEFRNDPVSVGDYTNKYFPNIVISGSLDTLNTDATITVNFFWVSPLSDIHLDVDVLKYRTLAEFGPELKKVLKFYSYTGKGNNASDKLVPPPLSAEPLDYEVIKWEDYIATIKFPSLAADVSNRLEARLDQYTYTHHNGRKLDMNNDGVIDEYDLIFLDQVTVLNSTNTGYSYNAPDNLTKYDPYSNGLGGGNFSYPGADPQYFSLDINQYAAIANENYNYENDLNNIYSLQKFSLTEKKWVDISTAEIKGVYNTSTGEYRYTISSPEPDVYYRVVIRSFKAYKEFAGKVKFYGYYQKLQGDAFSPLSSDMVVSTWQMPKLSTTSYVLVNPFTVPSFTHDDNYRNIVLTLAFTPSPAAGGTAVGQEGLPDPTPYLQNKQIFLGYSGGAGFSDLNQRTWNNLVFIPVTIIPYKDDPADHVENRWKVLLPADYEKPFTPVEKFLFITPDYKTKGDTSGSNVRAFGEIGYVDFVYNGNLHYKAYSLGSSF